ncbi:hypothetical protein CIK06_05225 [Plantactinospora sp. KBS50]|nr:hypothetical protein CIK06_05225 [Plantactinospora sp. KBS50]
MFAVPTIVARGLRSEPLLLTCFGATVLLAIVALAGPPGGAIYAWLLAGLTLTIGVVWAVLRAASRRSAPADGDDAGTPPGSNHVDLGHRPDIGDVDLRAAGRNSLRAGRRARMESLTMRAGLPEPVEPDRGQRDDGSPKDAPASDGAS